MTDVESHILKNYDIKRRIGKGAYGIVWQAVDRHTGEIVAVKKIFDAFCNATDAQRTYREIAFLQAFQSHENVIHLMNVIRAENNNDIYLVFEYMDIDLHGATKANLLKTVHKSYIMYQLFKVMKYIHSGNVIHRDLKPSNVLLNAECFVKLADFGLARSLTAHDQETVDPNKALMTDYVATRWYRAPEILLGSPHYTHGVDMWSLGCILGEMLGGKPVFSGSSTINQVERIMCHLPQPSKLDMESLDSPYTESFLRQVPKRPRRSFAMLYPNAPIEAIDLMNKLLQFNPQKRISAEKALEHAYVATFHNPEEETVLDSDVIPKLNDNYKCGVDKYRARLYESIDLRAKEGLSGISLDPHIHPVADPQCNNVATARGTRGSVSSSSESSLHTLKSHHSKTTSTPSREYKHGEQKSDKASTPGSDVHTLPPGSDVHTLPPGSDVHTLPPGSDVHTLPPGSDVHTLPPGSDVHTLPPGSDVHTHPPGSDVRTHPTGRRIHKVASDKHSVGPRLADTGQVTLPCSPVKAGKFRTVSQTALGRNAVLTRSNAAGKQAKEEKLCVTSARIIPQERPTQTVQKLNRRVARGAPTQFATYTQTHATISQSKLNVLRQCKW